MIDETKFEKLEKEDMEVVSGGKKVFGREVYNQPMEDCTNTLFVCIRCNNKGWYHGVYSRGEWAPTCSDCGNQMRIAGWGKEL